MPAVATIQFRDCTPEDFVGFRRRVGGRASFLSNESVEELRRIAAGGGRIRASSLGLTGYVVGPDGSLKNLFNAGCPGADEHAVRDAIALGANRLDCFDGFLPAYYARFGFVERDRCRWDDSLAPAGWDYDRWGRPDVVFMELSN